MSTLQVDQINPITLTELSPGTTPYMNNTWDVLFIKKLITAKWPYEVYKGSFLRDFIFVFFSKVS